MINLQRLTGARPGEVVLIRPCDIEKSDEVWINRPEPHKTQHHGIEREIYIGPQAQAVTRSVPRTAPESYYFSPIEVEAERNESRRQNRKSPMTPSQTARRPKANPARAKRQRYAPYSYRRAITYGMK